MTLFDQIGEAGLRSVLESFYDRVFADIMIGYHFKGVDPKRLVELEYQLVGGLLGGPTQYTGRSMRAAHAGAGILDGHFDRRTQILRETLVDHHVADAVAEVWLAHVQSLRSQVVVDAETSCAPPRVDPQRG